MTLSLYFQLDCSHVFHLQCTRRVLENRWLGPRITFGFMSCPICKVCNHTKQCHGLYEEYIVYDGVFYILTLISFICS